LPADLGVGGSPGLPAFFGFFLLFCFKNIETFEVFFVCGAGVFYFVSNWKYITCWGVKGGGDYWVQSSGNGIVT